MKISTFFNKFLFTLLTLLTFGVVNAWGGDCNYEFTKNEEKTSINNGEVIYRATINETYYGLSKLTFKVNFTKSLSLLHNESANLNYDIYLYNSVSKSWSKKESKTLSGYGVGDASETITYTADLANITAFKVISTTNFGSYKSWGKTKYTYRSVSVSNVAFQKVSSISADVPSLAFGSVTYGSSESKTVTATYMLSTSGTITATCTGDFSATSASCNCVNAPSTKTITVTFAPTQAGTREGVLTIKNPDGTQTTVNLSGTGVRANNSITMNNGSVNVTTDKSNPALLDLSTCFSSQTGNGTISYSLVSGPESLAGDAATNNCNITGNNFYAWVGGTYTIRATSSQTDQYNSATKDFTVTVNRLTQNIAWSTNETTFVEEDVISANSIGAVTLEKSGAGASYVTIDGNTATVGEVASNTTVTLTATAAATDVYAQATDSKTINLTSLQKQHITFDQNLTKLKTTDSPRKVELVATSDSNRDSYIYFSISANSDGVTVTQENGKWYLNYPAAACKNIMVTAHLDGVEGVSIAASDVSQMVKVTDPTAKCDNTESLATASGVKSASKYYDLTVPKQVVLKVRCSEKSLTLLQGYYVKFYNANGQQVGDTYEYEVSDGHYYNRDIITRTFGNLDKSITRMEFHSNASKGYDITEASYERWSYATPSVYALNYEAYALSTVADQSLTINYANYQVELSIEGSNNFVIKSDDSFGDCETYDTQNVTIGYNVPATAQQETAYLRIKDNAGTLLNSVTLQANVLGGLTQNIISHNIANSYKTTDLVNLTAETDRGLTNFSYSASPSGVADFSGAQMTFSQSGTIAITVTEAGNATFNEATKTVENVVVSKDVPHIVTFPEGTAVTYLNTLSTSTLSGGSADITLRGVPNSPVAGSFSWTTPSYQVTDAVGTHAYSVTFNPTDDGMYAPNTNGSISITVNKADQAISMNNGSVRVAVDGIDEGAADSYLDLNTLIASQTIDDIEASRAGAVAYEVISENKANTTISGSTFSATVCDTYTIRATKAQTDYYNEVTDEFTVTVLPRANTLATAGLYEKYVDEEVTSVATHINSDGTIHTSTSDETIAYYDIDNNKIVIPNSEAKSFNSTTVTIKIWQDATDRFEAAAEKTINLTVKKYDNPFACSWGSFAKTVNFNEVVAANFTTQNSDYTHFPIAIEQTSGEKIAELVRNDDTHNTITASYTMGNATWHLTQAESYKYKSATADVTLYVDVKDAAGCLLLHDQTEHAFTTKITDGSGHFDDPIALSGPVDKISFVAYRDLFAVSKFIVQYSVDNGSTWRDIARPDLSIVEEPFGPYEFTGLEANEHVSHIRFGASVGGTLTKHYKNIVVTRNTYLKAVDASNKLISSITMDDNALGGITTAKFKVSYSTCDDVIKIVSSDSHFTLDKTEIESAGDNIGNLDEVTISYSSNDLGPHSAVITIYTKYENYTFTVTGTTTKRVQTLTWKEGYTGNPLTLPIGLKADYTNIVVTASSERPVIFSSDDESVVQIILDGLGFEIVGEGTATITASEAGTEDIWFPVSETKEINATNRAIQEIVWDQDFIRNMTLERVIDLEAKVYINNLSIGEKTYSAERTALLSYTCPANDVISLDNENKKITVLGYGQTTITASLPTGDAAFEDAMPVSLIVKVPEPSTGCPTPLIVDQAQRIELFDDNVLGGSAYDFSKWTTPELTSEPILLNSEDGKPDKLSYQHNAEIYMVRQGGLLKLCSGKVTAQQRIDGTWYDITGSVYEKTYTLTNWAAGAYDWREVKDLQLNENADAIRFRRLDGGAGHHNFKDIQVTLKHYLRPTSETVNLGKIEIGEARTHNIGFEYSDIKEDLTAAKGDASDATYTVNETNIHIDCGTYGHYDLPITITPTELGLWSTTITITDNATNTTITIPVQATVIPGEAYVFKGSDGENGNIWGLNGNWRDGEKPGENDDVTIEANVLISGEVTVGSMTIAEGVTVTVSGTLNLGSNPSNLIPNYGDLHVLEGGQVNIGSGTFFVRDFILDAALGNALEDEDALARSGQSGQLSDVNKKMHLTRDAYFQLTLDPSGQVGHGYYDFVVPFEVNIADGIFRLGETKHLQDNLDFRIMEHSEALGAKGEYDWVTIHNTMYPGRVYTITLDDRVTQNVFLFKKKDGATLGGSNEFEAQYSSGSAAKRGWNGLGNGTLQHRELSGYDDETKVQLYDHAKNRFVPRVANQHTYAVGISFFMQVTSAQTITLAPATSGHAFLAPAREMRTVDEFMLTLTKYDSRKTVDYLWMSADEEATDEYVIGRDLLKLGTPTEAKVAQMWATKGENKLCDVETALVNEYGYAPLSFFSPKTDELILAVEEMPEDVLLFLTYNEQIVWELTASPYPIDLTQGVNEGYGLLVKRMQRITTGINETGEDSNAVRKVIINDKLYVITPEGAIYDITGKNIK